MEALAVTEAAAGCFNLRGDFNRHTIPKSAALDSLKKGCQQITADAVLTLDLGGVDHADTAALAWVMNFLKHAQRRPIQIELKNIPESLLKLAKISDVDSFLSVQ
ncbi:STAS domain-containing protein [uncultured Paraglaciecola sp.]|uniref:STAS domain-containing protein n=1 Tax=uncultured Paraglaciecola sp. TaxID=1765024 RepID=UPI00262D146F|nr:STAS domain-containing protein [uncultured Paraglaciecola sp.]